MQISDEIKTRLDIVDVVREYVPSLKPVGVNFTALSPFKREKTPSFVVSPEKQIWHCFSSGKGGDLISFVMEMEGVSFVEALRILAPKAGVVLRKENKEYASKRNRLLDIMDICVNYYHRALLESPQAQGVRDYLKKRDLDENTLVEWQIGYSPESWDDIINILKKRGFSDNEIFAAGISVKKENSSSRFYNRFRGRVMFPINDFSGNPVAFTARVSPEKEKTEVMGKYINSPQTMIYDKSKILFGLDKAKQAIREEKLAIVVEGQMDVITAHQNGFKNVVASSGTALTADQLKLIKRYTANVAFCFDMDEAGQLAADRAIKEAMAEEMNIKVITIPDGKDPDEYIKKDPEGWQKCAKEARHVMEYYFEKIFSRINAEVIEGKREAAAKILPIIARFNNGIERDFWIKQLSEKIDIPEQTLRDTLVKSKEPKKHIAKEDVPQMAEEKKEESREEKLSQVLMSLALKFPDLLNYIMDNITIDHIFGSINKIFYKNLIIYYNNIINNSSAGETIYGMGYKDLKENITRQTGVSIGSPEADKLIQLLDKLAIIGERDFFEYDMAQAKNEAIRVEIFLKESYYSFRKKELLKLISQSEREGDA
ncbi:DNA primase, partial [Candidatus Falkowbacteria bacterium]|nr:DNA primase [Candidatus Falkowbacteria bacterium]